MNHDDEHELFERLEADMATPDPSDDGGTVVDLDKHRKTHLTLTDHPDTDLEAGGPLVDGPEPTGPGLMERIGVPDATRSSPAGSARSRRWSTPPTADRVRRSHRRLPRRSRARYAAAPSCAPRGFANFAGGSLRWASDAEGQPLRRTAAQQEDEAEYLKLSRQRDRRVQFRAS